MKTKLDGKKEEAKPLTGREKLQLMVLVLIFGAMFLWIATSTWSNWIKAPALLLSLFVSGNLMAKTAHLENYYGIIILRGEKGFGIMHRLAKYPRTMRALADFGLSMGFGMIYSFWLFRSKPLKFLAHLILVSAFFGVMLLTNATMQSNLPITLIGILGGLLAFGVASMVIQALNILTVPGTTAGAALVVPGVTIPFWEGLIAIIIAATVHEIAHGVLAMVEKLEVKNSGAILFGVLPIGAFVEPNEAKLAQMSIHQRRRILIAGTTSNFFMFIIFILLSIPISNAIIGYADGVKVTSLTKDSAAAGILQENEILYAVNGVPMKTLSEFMNYMKDKRQGDVVALKTSLGEKSVKLGPNGKMGIIPENNFPVNSMSIGALLFIAAVFGWILVINFALAVINLVPIFLTDGYRLVYEEARGIFPSKNDHYAKRIAIAAGVLSVLLLLINFIPNFR